MKRILRFPGGRGNQEIKIICLHFVDLFAGILGLVHRLLEGVPQLLRLLPRVLPLVLHVVQLLPRILQIPAGQREGRLLLQICSQQNCGYGFSILNPDPDPEF